MSILFVGELEKAAIAAAIEAARARPVPLEALKQVPKRRGVTVLKLSDRVPGETEMRNEYPPQQVMLGTYRCALTFEQQPYGLARHLSVSSWRPGRMPGPEVMHMVAQEFGFSEEFCAALLTACTNDKPFRLSRPALIWVEEFDPGHMALNIAEAEGDFGVVVTDD